MGNPRSTFAKNERDRNKKARAAAKREKRLGKDEDGEGLDDDALEAATRPASTEPQDVVIEKLRVLHEDYEEERINDEDFEKAKADLLAKLTID